VNSAAFPKVIQPHREGLNGGGAMTSQLLGKFQGDSQDFSEAAGSINELVAGSTLQQEVVAFKGYSTQRKISSPKNHENMRS